MTAPQPSESDRRTGQHGAHSWMMIACCVPMLIVAIALVATGVVSAGFLLYAVGCTAMMVMMMRMMGGTRARARGHDVDERPDQR